MPKIILTLCLLLVVSGCTKLKHLPQLLTLKDLADTQETTDAYVDDQNIKFKELMDDYLAGNKDKYKDQDAVRELQGEPLFVSTEVINDQNVTIWMYRKTAEFWNTSKIYMHFDDQEQLIDWKLEEALEKN